MKCLKYLSMFLYPNSRLYALISKPRKLFWISYSNSNTFHVESIVRFKNMQKILVNAFFILNGKMVNSLNS